MRTEHEKLKEICDKIGYDTNIELYNWFYETSEQKRVNVREIIFTQEFMKCFLKLYRKEHLTIENSIYRWKKFERLFYNHLDNPVDYLYSLLEQWK